MALAGVASGGPPVAGAGGDLERDRPAGAGLSELVGRRAGNGGWRLLSQAPARVDGGELGVAGAGGSHQPAPLAASGTPGRAGGLPAGGRHAGVGHHREWSQPLAGARPGAAAAFRAGETFCGVAGCRAVRPLAADRQRPETALAGGVRHAHSADPQTAEPEHGGPHRTAVVVHGAGGRRGPALVDWRGRRRRTAGCRQHCHQRVPAAAGGVLSQPLAGRPGGWLPIGAEPAGNRLWRHLRRGLRALHPEAPVSADSEHRFHLRRVRRGIRLRRFGGPAGLPAAVRLCGVAGCPDLPQQPAAADRHGLHHPAGGAIDPEHCGGQWCHAHHRPAPAPDQLRGQFPDGQPAGVRAAHSLLPGVER